MKIIFTPGLTRGRTISFGFVFLILGLNISQSFTAKAAVVNPANGHCYQLVTNMISWTSARSAAQIVSGSLTGHLVSVTSAEENQFVLGLLPTSAKSLMIGATDEALEGQFQWVSGESFSFTNWCSGDPDNQGGNENYVYMLGPAQGANAGKWCDGHNGPNFNDIYYMVEWDGMIAMPAYNPANGHWYQVVTQMVSWTDAEVASRVVYNGMTGYLATVTSAAENEYILDLLPADAKSTMIGGTDAGTEGQFRWVTSEAFSSYTNWCPGDPDNQYGNENYVYMLGPAQGANAGKWCDGHNGPNANDIYYVIEWGGYESEPWLPQRVLNPANGHYYLLVTGCVSWVAAMNGAQVPYDGSTGYLVTVTSAAENQFILGLLPTNANSLMIGGTDEAQEGVFQWVTGESFTYANWCPGDPDNQGGNENYLYLLGPMQGGNAGKWCDGHNGPNPSDKYYMIEWGEGSTQTGIFSRAYNPVNGHWYQVVTQMVSWTDAEVASQIVYEGMTGYLATVTSAEENQFILGLLATDAKSAMIGGTDAGTEGQFRWVTGEGFAYANWCPGDPDNQYGNENYVYMLGPAQGANAGKWCDGHNEPNANDIYYVIEWGGYESEPWLPQRVYNPTNGHYYLLVTGCVSWTEAMNGAQVPYDGATGYLVTVTSADENQFILGLLPTNAKSVMIGGTDEALEGQFRWVTGESFGYTNWCPGDPDNQFGNENYLYMLGPAQGANAGKWCDGHNGPNPNDIYYMIEWGEGSTQTGLFSRAYNPVNGHWYQVVEDAVSWDYALSACQIVYEGMTGYLATVTSTQENEFIAAILPTNANFVLLGGSDKESEGQWSWVTGEGFGHAEWRAGQPDNMGGVENFLVIRGPICVTDVGRWDDNPGQQHPDNTHYVIEWGGVESEEAIFNPVFNPTNGHYYLVMTNPVSWWSALQEAQIVYRNMTGYLATATSEQENTFISQLLGANDKYVHLGATDEEIEGTWRWITGESFDYTNWHPGDPNNAGGCKDYMAMNGPGLGANLGLWTDGRGNQSHDYGCYVVEWGEYVTLSNYLDRIREDMDGDGTTDDEEEGAGTNPYNGDSIFVLNDLLFSGDNVIVLWRTVYGLGYRVQGCRPNQEWQDLSAPIYEYDEYPDGVQQYIHVGAVTNAEPLFYRVLKLPNP